MAGHDTRRQEADVAPLVPDWLAKWWLVTYREFNFYYLFRPDFSVRWSMRAPVSSGAAPAEIGDTGTYTVSETGEITINWSASGKTEWFNKTVPGSPFEDTMAGFYNGAEPICAVTYF